MDDATFQGATLNVINLRGSMAGTLRWNDTEESIELVLTGEIPTLSEWGMIIFFAVLMVLAYRKFKAPDTGDAVAGA